jgi:hypothetical protein
VDKAFRIILLPFIVLAAVGFVLSVAAHISAVAGHPIPGGKAVWALHIGIFIVWSPTVLVAYRLTRGAKRKDFWKVALAGCPKWMRIILYGIFAYAALNFISFMIVTVNHPQQPGDAPPEVVRGFSGHWMIFYWAAFAALYSASAIGYSGMDRKCPNGHSVGVTAKYCEECGAELPPSSLERRT